jgi:hypothetical protein
MILPSQRSIFGCMPLNYDLGIYGFNLTSSEVTPGGYLNLPATDSYFVAQRY